jgi:alpha-D-ribose 1-methylphosphonate 5-triphosphate diphosphatase PhnM
MRLERSTTGRQPPLRWVDASRSGVTTTRPSSVRGGSHCGNLAVHEAIAEGLVDMLCSDYHFPSLLASAVLMFARGESPSRIAELLALNPARHLGIDADFGSIEAGKSADLVAFQPRDGYADVICTWVGGLLQFAARNGYPHRRARCARASAMSHASGVSRSMT